MVMYIIFHEQSKRYIQSIYGFGRADGFAIEPITTIAAIFFIVHIIPIRRRVFRATCNCLQVGTYACSISQHKSVSLNPEWTNLAAHKQCKQYDDKSYYNRNYDNPCNSQSFLTVSNIFRGHLPYTMIWICPLGREIIVTDIIVAIAAAAAITATSNTNTGSIG